LVISVLPDSLNVLAAEQIPLFCDGEAICPIKPPYSLRITNGTAANTNTIIADCYNANPSSVMESLKSFKAIKEANKIAVLGDMLELGEVSTEEHLAVITFLEKEKIDAVLVGNEFLKVKSKYPTFQNTDKAIDFLNKKDFKNFTILLKGSRGIKLEKLIDTTIF